jgi:hypothetical protein
LNEVDRAKDDKLVREEMVGMEKEPWFEIADNEENKEIE